MGPNIELFFVIDPATIYWYEDTYPNITLTLTKQNLHFKILLGNMY